MTAKADFDAASWEKISRAPAIAAMYVITAQKGGAIRESMAVGKVYAEAREKSTGSPLVERRQRDLESLERELVASRKRVGKRRRELAAERPLDAVASTRD